MSITLGSIGGTFGRIALFLIAWIASALSFTILLALLFGIISLPIVAFGAMPPLEAGEMREVTDYVLLAALGIGTIVGLRIATSMVAYTLHKDEARFDKETYFIGYFLMWGAETFIFTLGLLFCVLVFYGHFYNMPGGTEAETLNTLQEARYAVLAAVIAAGYLAALSLRKRD